MPKFEAKNGTIIDVTEERALMFRRQGEWKEIGDDKVSTEVKSEEKPQEVGSTPTISTKKKAKKKK